MPHHSFSSKRLLDMFNFFSVQLPEVFFSVLQLMDYARLSQTNTTTQFSRTVISLYFPIFHVPCIHQINSSNTPELLASSCVSSRRITHIVILYFRGKHFCFSLAPYIPVVERTRMTFCRFFS